MNTSNNILIAEDDREDFNFLAGALKNICSTDTVNITRAKNRLECMALVKKDSSFDVIFIDLNMPGYDGVDCLRFIKSSTKCSNVPVVIYSTSHYIKDIDACFKNEAHYYIVKPASDIVLFRSSFKNIYCYQTRFTKTVKRKLRIKSAGDTKKLNN